MGGRKRKPEHFARAWRQFQQITQADLADRVGQSPSTVSAVERFERPISDVRRWCDALHISPNQLFYENPLTGRGQAKVAVLDAIADASRRWQRLLAETVRTEEDARRIDSLLDGLHAPKDDDDPADNPGPDGAGQKRLALPEQ